MRAVKSVHVVDEGWGKFTLLFRRLERVEWDFPLRSLCLGHGHVTLTDDPMLTRGREGRGEGTGREGRG